MPMQENQNVIKEIEGRSYNRSSRGIYVGHQIDFLKSLQTSFLSSPSLLPRTTPFLFLIMRIPMKRNSEKMTGRRLTLPFAMMKTRRENRLVVFLPLLFSELCAVTWKSWQSTRRKVVATFPWHRGSQRIFQTAAQFNVQ